MSSFLLTATHGFIPALSWPMTGRPKMFSCSGSAADTVGFVTKQQTAFLDDKLDPPSFAAVLFVTVKIAKHNVPLLHCFQAVRDLHRGCETKNL